MPGGAGTPHDRCGPRCTSPGAARFRPTWARPLRHAPRYIHDMAAVTPVVATILILAISAIGIAAVMSWGLPSVQQTQALTEVEGLLAQFHAFDLIAESVLHGGAVGKASHASINFPTGEVQRTVDSLFVIAWHPDRKTGNPDKIYVRGFDDSDPRTIEVVAAPGVDTTTYFVYAGRVDDEKTHHTAATGALELGQLGFTNRIAAIDIEPILPTGSIDHDDVPTRIVVTDMAAEETVMEAWIFPTGMMRYVRHTSFGNVAIRLENSCVITEYETGDFIRNRPLAVVDRNANNEIIFAALFQQLLVDNLTYPGVQAAGAGSFPILWTLQNNHLRAPGDPVWSAHLNVTGRLGPLWQSHYESIFGFVPDGDGGVRLDAAAGKPFDFVVMENRIEVIMKPDTLYLGTVT